MATETRITENEATLIAAVKALLASADHTLPSAWRVDRPVQFAKAAIAKAEGRES